MSSLGTTTEPVRAGHGERSGARGLHTSGPEAGARPAASHADHDPSRVSGSRIH